MRKEQGGAEKRFFVKSAVKSIKSILFLALVGIILFNLGKGAISKFGGEKVQIRRKESVMTSLNYNLGEDVLSALGTARSAAYAYADSELDEWTGEVMQRVDDDFLDDYFGFLQTKSRELKALGYSAMNFLNISSETAEDKLTEELEEKISSKVIRPEISEKRIENITNEAIVIYLSTLDDEFSKIQAEHKIPYPEWNEYISDICGITKQAESKAFPVSIKTTVMASGALAVLAAKPVVAIARKASEKIAVKSGMKVAEKAGTKVAVKTAAKGAAKTGGSLARAVPFIGWAVTVGVAAWDIIDYKMSATKGKEMLRENIKDYLAEVKAELLGNSDGSIMGSITLWENDVKAEISKKC